MKSRATIPPAITPASFERMVASWAKIVRAGESGSVWYYNKSDLFWRIANLRENKTLYRKYFSNQKLIVIDAESFRGESEEDWNKALRIVNNRGSEMKIFFILGLERCLLEGETRIFNLFQKKEKELWPVSFLAFFTIDFTHPRFRTLFSGNSTLLQNTVITPLHSESDARQYIIYKSRQWGIKLNERQTRAIVSQCGGYFLLIKEVLRYFRDNQQSQEEAMLSHPAMRWRLEFIWRNFLPSEQAVLQKVVQQTTPAGVEEQHSLKFLTDSGFIYAKGKNREISIPLLAGYIQDLSSPFILIVEKDRIFYNGVPIENNFSPQEQKLLRYFINNPARMLSRDEISADLSGNDDDSILSDWAIDQLISRIRKRLAHLGISPQIIKTIRAKGFICLPEK